VIGHAPIALPDPQADMIEEDGDEDEALGAVA
jgi:hypothetical protein